jgi:hypothetical protein
MRVAPSTTLGSGIVNRRTNAGRQVGVTASVRLRTRQVRLLLKPSLRAVRWVPLIVIAPLGFAIVRMGLHERARTGEAPLAVAGVLLAVWIGFVLDDPAAESVSAVPTPLLFRRGIRIAMALPVVWVLWSALSVYAAQGWKTPSLATAFAAQLIVALACAALGIRVTGQEHGGLFAVGGLFVVSFLLPQILGLPVALDRVTSTWSQLYGRSIVIVVAGLITFLVASEGRGRRGVMSMIRRLWSRPPVVAGEKVR